MPIAAAREQSWCILIELSCSPPVKIGGFFFFFFFASVGGGWAAPVFAARAGGGPAPQPPLQREQGGKRGHTFFFKGVFWGELLAKKSEEFWF